MSLVDELQILLQSAITEQRRGETASASEKYRQVVAARPDRWDALYLLGTALLQLNRYVEAIDVFGQVAVLRPQMAEVHNNIGVAYQALGDLERASRRMKRPSVCRAMPSGLA